MSYNYPPLDFAVNDLKTNRNLTFTGDKFTNYSEYASDLGATSDMTFDEYVNYALSCKIFAKEVEDERFKECNEAMASIVYQIKNTLHILDPDELRGEALDSVILLPIIRKWYQCKQVYKLDADFANALLRTNKAKISKDQIMHLPFTDFYVDISDLNYAQLHGIFVHICYNPEDDNIIDIVMYIMTNDQVLYSRYTAIDFYECDEFVINYDKDIPDQCSTDILDGESFGAFNVAYYKDAPEKFSLGLLTTLVYQLLIYMGISEKDVEDSPVTKSTYRPRKPDSPIKNKFSELQILNVGLRYGSEFRRKIKELNINRDELEIISEGEEEDEEIDDNLELGEESKRKPPRPHLRSAHWTHRWCGPRGDQHLELRWIEPVFVGFGKDAILNQATLHVVNGD